jgi:rod shape-determining protein MreC
MHIGPWSAEVILVTDPEHAVPVQVERTGLRTIAVGAGNEGALTLPYLPANADVKRGDLLITSGLGGVFPPGYPVARVSEVHRDAVQPAAQIRAVPLARIDHDHEVALVWFKDVRVNNPEIQAQPAPHKSAPAATVPAPATSADATASAAKPAPKAPAAHPPDVAPKSAPPEQAEDAVK